MLDRKRREFMSLIGGAAVAWPLVAHGQTAGKLPTIGFLGAGSPSYWSSYACRSDEFDPNRS
jgi:putative ABC transport system substrate-binding protein